MTEDMLNNPQDYPSMPLVRLRLEYTGGYTPVNVSRFSEPYKRRIANFKNFVYFYKRKDFGKKYEKESKKKADILCLAKVNDNKAEFANFLENVIKQE